MKFDMHICMYRMILIRIWWTFIASMYILLKTKWPGLKSLQCKTLNISSNQKKASHHIYKSFFCLILVSNWEFKLIPNTNYHLSIPVVFHFTCILAYIPIYIIYIYKYIYIYVCIYINIYTNIWWKYKYI